MRIRTAASVIVAAATVLCAAVGARATRYGFYRSLGGAWSGPAAAVFPNAGTGTRRVFGGRAAELAEFPAACALLDRYWAARCSAAVVTPRWVLTAAHCVTNNVAYVKYNSRRPAHDDGAVTPVHYLYRHPGFQVVQEDEGRGMDVTQLHHDVGLVRTRLDMHLASAPPAEPLRSMRQYRPDDIKNAEVQVLGFGRTEQSKLGEELFSVRLQVVGCDRTEWVHCACGVALPGSGRAAAGGGGVCSGDSGGPVLLADTQVQVAVTSMGPLECAGAAPSPAGTATSVFTALQPYVDLINATIYDIEAVVQMRRMSGAPPPPALPAAATLVALVALVLPAR